MSLKKISRVALFGAFQSFVSLAVLHTTAPRLAAQRANAEQPLTVVINEAGAAQTQPAEDGDQIVRRLRERREREGRADEVRGGEGESARREAQQEPRSGWMPAERGPKVTFLGVTASQAPEVLSRQLDLQPDVGLVIDRVEPDSPAARAGLKQFDLLQKFDDQLLVDSHQLSVLVKNHKNGDRVAVELLRQARPATLNVTLGEHFATEERQGVLDIEPQALRLRLPGEAQMPMPQPLGGGFLNPRPRPGSAVRPQTRPAQIAPRDRADESTRIEQLQQELARLRVQAEALRKEAQEQQHQAQNPQPKAKSDEDRDLSR